MYIGLYIHIYICICESMYSKGSMYSRMVHWDNVHTLLMRDNLAQATCVLFDRYASTAHSSSLCLLSVDNGRMLTILFASENNNIYHDPSHGYASIVFRLGSGA